VSQSKGTPELVGRSSFLANKMKDYRVLQFLFFMDDLLKVIINSSLNFQNDWSTCLDFLDAPQTATLELVQLRQQPDKTIWQYCSQ